MMFTAYVLKNRLSGIFERPFVEPYDVKDYPDLLAQSLAVADVDALNRHKEFDLYVLGSFDNKSGILNVFQGSPGFVMSLEQLCNSYIVAKTQKKDDANA